MIGSKPTRDGEAAREREMHARVHAEAAAAAVDPPVRIRAEAMSERAEAISTGCRAVAEPSSAMRCKPSITEGAAAPSAAALRMRRHQERRRDGLRCMMVELRETEVTALIRKGLLDDARYDLQAVKNAFYALLEHLGVGSCSTHFSTRRWTHD